MSFGTGMGAEDKREPGASRAQFGGHLAHVDAFQVHAGNAPTLTPSVHTPMRCIVVHMSRTNIDIDDELIHRVMVRYHLTTKREAVDYALRSLVGNPMTKEEILSMAGSIPDFEVPPDDDDDDYIPG